VTRTYGAAAWRISTDDWAAWTAVRAALEKEAPALPKQARPIRRAVMLALVRYLWMHARGSAQALQSLTLYLLMYWCMLRGRDVIRGNLWVQDIGIAPRTSQHPGGVQLVIHLDKNRKKTLAGSISFALSTRDVLDPVPALKLYMKRMGWDAERPPPRTPLFPRLSDSGRVTGQFYTAKDIIARMRQHMEDAGVAEAGTYSLSGFRPGGHTDMLVATDGDHSVSDGIARWDTAAAERRYDRRDADAWLAKMARAQRAGVRIGVDAGERAS
jgi:hypothetical protein